jgi:hypothetical protein
MPAAICTTCNQVSHWRNQRGVRLADLKCRCGGELKSATWKDGAYQIRESAKGKGNTGRKKAACAICGNLCIAAPGQEAVTATLYGRWYSWRMPIVIEADDPVCYRHYVRPPSKSAALYVSDFDIETQDWLSKQVNEAGICYSSLADD